MRGLEDQGTFYSFEANDQDYSLDAIFWAGNLTLTLLAGAM